MTASPSLVLAPGLLIGDRYRLEELIGQGGFGAVYRATQLNLGRSVAIKVMLPELLDNDGLLRFQREAELLQRLSHPNTVGVLDFGRAADGSPFLVFELLKGYTLESEIVRRRGLSPTRVGRVATQILKSLMEAHGQGIVHRDIKPANVFLCDFEGERDFVKVLDFGIAVGGDARSLTRNGQIVGTPRYMAPEQLMGQPATFAADLYALGITMSEAISGRPLYAGLTGMDIAREKVTENPAPHAPEVLQSSLGPVIHRATQRQPSQRYASAADMLAHLGSVLDAGSSERISRPTAAISGPPVEAGGPTNPVWVGPVGPMVPRAPEAARARKRSAPPWVLLPMIGGVAALLMAALFVVMPKRPEAEAKTAPSTGQEVTEGRPVVLTGNLGNSGWMVAFHVLDPAATTIEYKHPGDADFVSTGLSHDVFDPATNLPLPNRFVILPDLHGKVPFEVRYRSKSGRMSGPHHVVFDTTKEAVASVKHILTLIPEWVIFRGSSGKKLAYFSTLISYHYAFSAIRYGVDSDVPDRSVRFTPGDTIGGSSGDETVIELPAGTSSVTVELTFIDGTRSERKRFPVRVDR